MRRIFMVSYGGGHANIMKLLYKKLYRNEDVELIYLALTGAPYQLRNDGIDYVTISDLVKKLPYYNEIVSLGEKYGKQFHNPNANISYCDSICYYGLGLYDLIMEKGETEALLEFERSNRKSFLPVYSMKCILEMVDPDVCVVTTSPRIEMATGIAANTLNIPVVRINDVPTCEHIMYKCSLCVMNTWAKNFAEQNSGLLQENIYITGQPVFEDDIVLDEVILHKIEKELTVELYNKVVTFFTENGYFQKKELEAISNIAKDQKDTLFIIKIHPNQDEQEFVVFERDNVLVSREPAKYFFSFSNIIINAWSTTGMEAAMMGLPLIVVNFDDRTLPIDYVNMEIAVLSRNEMELRNVFSELLEKESELNKKLENGRRKFEYISDSTQKVCDVILQTMKYKR